MRVKKHLSDPEHQRKRAPQGEARDLAAATCHHPFILFGWRAVYPAEGTPSVPPPGKWARS